MLLAYAVVASPTGLVSVNVGVGGGNGWGEAVDRGEGVGATIVGVVDDSMG